MRFVIKEQSNSTPKQTSIKLKVERSGSVAAEPFICYIKLYIGITSTSLISITVENKS